MDFEPVSELNSTSSAFAGLFWDPKSNWIVVSFKGTAPLEFGEWLSDLNTKLVECGSDIRNFSKCHLGFKERVFPSDVSGLGDFRPYDTIVLGVKTLAKWLKTQNNLGADAKINVWFTGHSLGCAVASLVYSRMLMHDEDLGKTAILRDAYIFAAPITTDRTSVDVFNQKMKNKPDQLKTMWRITSNGDVVATLLPDLGDRRSITVSPNNAFAFAHLGAELIMKDHPKNNNVSGSHMLYGSPVSVHSKFSPQEIAAQRAAHLLQPGEQRREQIGVLIQKIPLIGRVAAHATVFYWDQLSRIGLGTCDWVVQ
ncbi:alpha/beta-hydrolase [Clavulina sp. PMI_390]|nr:alpha/beta-hydrolase [Clavulina sp. PMI_390]